MARKMRELAADARRTGRASRGAPDYESKADSCVKGGVAFAYCVPRTGAVAQVSCAGGGWAELLALAAAIPTRHFEVDIYFGLTSRTWTLHDLPRKSAVKRLKVSNPWHKSVICRASSDHPDIIRSRPRPAALSISSLSTLPSFAPSLEAQALFPITQTFWGRPRDATVALRPHPATDDIFVCFDPAPVDAARQGSGGDIGDGARTISSVTLTLRPAPDGKSGDGSGEDEEELCIFVKASWA